MRSKFRSLEQLQFAVEKFGAVEGAKQTIGRLAALVESQAA